MKVRFENPTLRKMSKWLGIAFFFLAVLTTRVVVSSRAELLSAQKSREEGEIDRAIVHYRRAGRWYAPGNPYSKAALVELAEIGRSAETGGDIERALTAWRGVRAAIMSTRSFYTPHRERLTEANHRIASLMASQDPPPIDAGKSRAQLEGEHYQLLSAPERPKIFWTIVLLLGFAAWVGGAFAFVTRGLDEEGRLIRREAKHWGVTIVLGFALFVLGMALA